MLVAILAFHAAPTQSKLIFAGIYGGDINDVFAKRTLTCTEFGNSDRTPSSTDYSVYCGYSAADPIPSVGNMLSGLDAVALRMLARDNTTVAKMFHPGQAATVASWISAQHVSGDLLVVAGHSAGGGDAQDVAWLCKDLGIPIRILAQIDSIEAGGDAQIPDNVAYAYNYYQNESAFIVHGEDLIYPADASKTVVQNTDIDNPVGPSPTDTENYAPHRNIDNDPRVWGGIDQFIADDPILSPPPTISSISPSTLTGLPLPQTQVITITGTGFTSATRLTFNDGTTSYSDRIPTSFTKTQLTYSIAVGPNARTWTVKAVNGNHESDPVTFSVTVTATLTGLSISGPSAITEGDSDAFTATASYSDGSTRRVTPSWSENSSAASITAVGILTGSEVSANTVVTVTATYAEGGVSKIATASVTIVNTSGGGSQTQELITNGGFESGSTGWSMSGPIIGSNAAYPHTGSRYAVLGEGPSATDSMYQEIDIPSDATSVTLSYWLNIYSLETGTEGDFFVATIMDTSDNLLAVIDMKDNLDGGTGTGSANYRRTTSDLSGFAGDTIRVRFASTMNASGFTSFKLDDVSVTAVVPEPNNTVATPTISPPSGLHSGSVDVSLDCDTSGASIRYTTDGSTPTTSSTLYDGTFTLYASSTVKAKAFKSGYTASSVAAASYTIEETGDGRLALSGFGDPITNGCTTISRDNATEWSDITIGEGGIRHSFRITNTGEGLLRLTSSPTVQLAGSAAFSVYQAPSSSQIAPGEYTTFKILFDPQTVGEHRATVSIRSNDAETPSFTYTVGGVGKDITPPTVTITSPTGASTYQTSSGSLALSGTASDNVGVTQVTWSNDRGGTGTAAGSASWSIAVISLRSGLNTITVAARDGQGYLATDVILVTFTPTQPEITANRTSLSAGAAQGTAAPSQAFTIRNTGAGTLNYQVQADTNAPWLSVSPTSGASSGEEDPITVGFASAGLPAGRYTGTVTVTATGALSSPTRIPVVLLVQAVSPITPYEAKSALSTHAIHNSFASRQNLAAYSPDDSLAFFSTLTTTAVVGGVTFVANGVEEDFYGVKLDSTGAVAWVRQYGGTNEEQVEACAPHPAGGWVITGYFRYSTTLGPDTLNAVGNRDAFIARLDSNGIVLWARRGGGSKTDYGKHVAVDPQGNCYFIGEFTTSATFSGGSTTLTASGTRFDIFVAKYTAAGNFVWARSFGGSNYDTVECAGTDTNGNVYIGGLFEVQASFGSYNLSVQGDTNSWDGYVAKVTSNGDVAWAKRFGEPAGESSSDTIDGLGIAADGTCFLVGDYSQGPIQSEGHSLPKRNDSTAFAGKISREGSVEWLRAIAATGSTWQSTYVYAATPLQDGGLLAAGSFQGDMTFGSTTLTNSLPFPAVPPYNLFFAKFDSSGAPLWALHAASSNSGGVVNYIGPRSSDRVRVLAKLSGPTDIHGVTTIPADTGESFVIELGPPTPTTPPTITSISDQTLLEDAVSSPIPFLIEALNVSPDALELSAHSSNSNLIPDSGLLLGGAGGSRTLTLTPRSNENGSVTITVTVSNGTLSARSSFTATVQAVNDAPAAPINLSPTNAANFQPLILALSASAYSDVESDAHTASHWQVLDSLGLTVVWDSGVNTSNRVSITLPEGQLEYAQNYSWQVRYQDAQGTWSPFSAATLFSTLPPPDSDGNGLPDWWTQLYFGSATSSADNLSRPSDDADADGLTNLQELYAGTDPRDPSSTLSVGITRNSSGSTITFAPSPGKVYVTECKDSMMDPTWVTVSSVTGGIEGSVQILDQTGSTRTGRFYRVRLIP